MQQCVTMGGKKSFAAVCTEVRYPGQIRLWFLS